MSKDWTPLGYFGIFSFDSYLGLIWFDIEGKGSFSLIQIGRLLKRIMMSIFEYFWTDNGDPGHHCLI